MAEINRALAFGKLNSIAYKCMQAATLFAQTRGNPDVEIVHVLQQILTLQDTDVHHILGAFAINTSKVASDIMAALERLPRGSGRAINMARVVDSMVEEAWKYASLIFNQPKIRTGHLLVALLKTPDLQRQLLAVSGEFSKIKIAQLTDDYAKICASSPEDALAKAEAVAGPGGGEAAGDGSGQTAPAALGKQEALNKFSTDLTAKARKGELDPIVGRDEEIRQIVDVLMRRRQNNPILTGEAGVGKTAVVEGFAHRIVAGDVPPALKEVSLRALDVGLMQAGASVKGEFEQRLRSVIDEVQASPKPIILFIDEAHTLIGAGGAAGTGDAANLLKPALARGTLRTIAATTWDEYKKHIEKDAALVRRFQVIKVDEPSETRAITMMRAVVSPFEKHHKVQILDEAIETAVKLSARYIPAQQLPDKCVKLLDTAAARVGVSQYAVPAEVDDCRRRIQALDTEAGILKRESAVGMEHATRLAEITEKLNKEKELLKGLEEHWTQEKDLVAKILDLRGKLRAAGSAIEAPKNDLKPGLTASKADALTNEQRDQMLAELKELQGKLTTVQGETPLIFPCVDSGAVAAVVGDWTGIPVGRMNRNELQQVLNLADILEKRVIGQRHALETITKRIKTSRAKLDNPQRPVGVFMLAGPSGTGKTELALTLAEALYGGEQNLIKINMAEFQEAHTVSTLKGSPPGYVGYGEGGVLTEAVRRRPYSVVLLDEVEKAHRDVHEIFFEVFDKGHMEDAEGRDIDFKNTLIILTTNAAQDVVMNMCKDPTLLPDAEGLEKALRAPLTKVFPDALLNRLLVVPFYPISKDMLKLIIKLQLSRVTKRVLENHKIPFTFDETVPALIAERCTELERGARMVEALITNSLLPAIGQEFLTATVEGRTLAKVHVTTADGDFKYVYA